MKFNVEKNNRMTAYVWAISGYDSRCYVESKLVAEEIGSVEEQPRTVQRQKHRANALSESTEEFFKRNITIPFLKRAFLNRTEEQ